MNKKLCVICGRYFIDQSSTGWAKKCILCWKTEQGYAWGKADYALKALQEEFYAQSQRLEELENPENQLAIEFNGLNEIRLKTLLKLCHPDRHKNSEESSSITKWLLQLKQDPKKIDPDWMPKLLSVLEDRHFVSWEDLEAAASSNGVAQNLQERQEEIEKLFSIAGFTYGRAVDLDGVKKIGFWHVPRTKELRAKHGL